MGSGRGSAVRLAGSHLITTFATLAAILLFVGIGSQLLPAVLSGVDLRTSNQLTGVALLLNVAIILFGWRRSKDLREALNAWEQAERAASRNAHSDHLTGLANRHEFMRSLGELLSTKHPCVLLLLDLDHFKRVNDLHGHVAGDRLLCSVADALKDSAPQGSCCARLGGDEFAILLSGMSEQEAEAVASEILGRLSRPVRIGAADVHIGGSIGLAHIESSSSEEEVFRCSDVALYAAKRSGRNCIAWFNAEMEQDLTNRLKLEEDIRAGIENGEFVPYFQPLIDLATRELAGFETLARWRSPTRGILEPDDFIPQAEAAGLIGPLTLSVMEQALREARDWPSHLKVAVNIAPVQFRDSTLAEQVLKVLSMTGFPANRLELEITEGALLEDREQVMTIIRSLKAVGIRISLDDFGTGYASLAQLDMLPVDRIKIDRSFISTLVKSDRTAAIVDTITTLGHRLNVPISAEGVETEWVRRELSSLGCTQAQGWLFGRPVSAEMLRDFLEMGGGAVGPVGHSGGEDDSFAPPEERRTGSEG